MQAYSCGHKTAGFICPTLACKRWALRPPLDSFLRRKLGKILYFIFTLFGITQQKGSQSFVKYIDEKFIKNNKTATEFFLAVDINLI